MDHGLARTAQGTSGTFEDQAPGSFTCDGPVGGVTPTGPGKVTTKGRYGTADPDDCLRGGEGDGTWAVTFPTSGGDVDVVIPFTLTWGGPSTHGGLVAVHVKGDGFTGELGVTPRKGDCVSAPVTEIRTAGKVVFS